MAARYASARQRMRRRRLKRILASVMGLIFVLIAGFAGYSLANSSFFYLDEIEVEGAAALSREELVTASGLRLGENLLQISRRQVAESLLAHPYIKDVQVNRRLPNKISIRVEERTPFALVNSGGRYLIMDADGHCMMEVGLAAAESWTLPSIRRSGEVSLPEPGGETADEGILAALTLIQKLDPFFLANILEFDVPSAEKLTVINTDGLPVYFGLPEDLDRKLQNYEELLIKNRERCNAQTLNYVDLRYDTQPTLSWK